MAKFTLVTALVLITLGVALFVATRSHAEEQLDGLLSIQRNAVAGRIF